MSDPVLPPRPTAAEAYLSLLPHLKRLAKKFARAYGGDAEEWLSFASPHFVRAFASWDPTRGPLKARISFVVWNRMKDALRHQIERHESLPRVDADVDSFAEESADPWDPEDLLPDLSEDGRVALRAALRYPHEPGLRKRGLIVGFLIELGWCGKRILESFKEVRDLLR